jgi:hypothetical protein
MADDDIYHEISEDLRQQKLELFWKENGSWIIGGVIAAIVFTGALSWWRQHQFEHNMTVTAALTAAMNTADPMKLELFSVNAGKNHALLARFAEAQVYMARKENDKAAAVYAEIVKMSRIDKTWRDLAWLYGIGTKLDNGDPAALHADLAQLTAPKSAWRYSALEMEALLYAREGKMTEAEDVLAKLLSDPLTPGDIRTRALTLRELYLGNKTATGNK